MINGVDEIFIIPPAVLVLLAAGTGALRLPKHGAKGAVTAAVLVLIGGAVLLFLLYLLWLAVYFGSGGH